eukprot:5804443-Amphidinium_carterae.3
MAVRKIIAAMWKLTPSQLQSVANREGLTPSGYCNAIEDRMWGGAPECDLLDQMLGLKINIVYDNDQFTPHRNCRYLRLHQEHFTLVASSKQPDWSALVALMHRRTSTLQRAIINLSRPTVDTAASPAKSCQGDRARGGANQVSNLLIPTVNPFLGGSSPFQQVLREGMWLIEPFACRLQGLVLATPVLTVPLADDYRLATLIASVSDGVTGRQHCPVLNQAGSLTFFQSAVLTQQILLVITYPQDMDLKFRFTLALLRLVCNRKWAIEVFKDHSPSRATCWARSSSTVVVVLDHEEEQIYLLYQRARALRGGATSTSNMFSCVDNPYLTSSMLARMLWRCEWVRAFRADRHRVALVIDSSPVLA